MSLSPDKSVRFDIRAIIRPSDPFVRLSGPIGRAIQKGGTRGYSRALQRFVEEDATRP